LDTRRVASAVQDILEPIVVQHGIELVDVKISNEEGKWILRVTIDCEDGVTVRHCTTVSRELSVHLDVEDLIPVQYNLEVTSPGLTRRLKDEKDFTRFVGRAVKIKTYRKVSGRRNIRGTLQGYDEGLVKINLDDGVTLDVPIEDISSAKLDFNF